MSEKPFNSNEYWLERGKTYVQEDRLKDQFYQNQSAFILRTVLSFAPRSILELGCGFGRITRELGTSLPEADILGLDLSPEQIIHAKEYCAEQTNVHFASADITRLPSFLPYDICLATELFLHLDHAALLRLIPRVMRACPVLIHDFDVEPTDFVSPHVHVHDYESIYSAMGYRVETQIEMPYGLKIVNRY